MSVCRCGFTGDGPHPCHRCHKWPGQARNYMVWIVGAIGLMRKTWACEACWAMFLEARKERERCVNG